MAKDDKQGSYEDDPLHIPYFQGQLGRRYCQPCGLQTGRRGCDRRFTSGLTGLSKHGRMITSGVCPEASLRRSETTLRDRVLPAANRALPAIRLAQISSAEG